MISYEKIVKVINESVSINAKRIVIRQLEIELSKNITERKPVKVITGIRRSGKSFLLKRLYLNLVQNSIPKSNILFLNFENDLLINYLNLQDLRKIFEIFNVRKNPDFRLYLFFDEIQNIENWEKFVRSLYDSTDYEIYITGSNSHLLSGEIASVLGGRILEYHIMPMCFTEYLDYHNFNYKDVFFKQQNVDVYTKLCLDYIEYGGFPETFYLDDEYKKNYRESLFEKIVINDILKRYKITKPQFLKNIFLYLSKNTGSIINYSNIASYADINDKTVEKYIHYFKNVFLVKEITKLEWKSKKIFESQKKFYFIDNLFTGLCIESRKLENLVYIGLVRRYGMDHISFLRNEKGQEVDFIVKNKGSSICIQVCWDLNDDNIKKEMRSLLKLSKYRENDTRPQDTYLIIVYEDSRKNKQEYERISIVNVFDFLIGGD